MRYTQRTSDCGSLCEADAEKTVTLNGWIHKLRDHGGIYFIDVRDRYGRTQILIDGNTPSEARELASTLHLEYCIAITGLVKKRDQAAINPQLSTGKIEVHVQSLEILSTSKVLPFTVSDNSSAANEDLRLKYRYIDLRSATMQYHIQLRHRVMQIVRNYLNKQNFLEIETPTLIRSTPEGARDFLVPSRMKAGTFYALPQSPQLYKQILMMSGMDKYYQFARCYRDEDSRGDRQPEHTQIDIEMSFVVSQDIYTLIEGMMHIVFKETLNISLNTPFKRLTYKEAMNNYGSDKPDLRFDLRLQDFEEFVPELGFSVFEKALAINQTSNIELRRGSVKMLCVPNAENMSRKQIEQLEEVAKKYGAKGLAWAKYSSDSGFSGGISKFLANKQSSIVARYNLQHNDLLLFVADTWHTTCTALGAVRNAIAKICQLLPSKEEHTVPSVFSFVWITDFPLFEWVEDTQSWTPAHHMFTMPQPQYLETLSTNPGEVRGELYDLVCNGLELASGSIRIHSMETQQQIFDIIEMPKEEVQSRFGFLLEALKYGPPPHGGIAPGLDRLLMLMTGTQSIREVIPFPKNTLGTSPLDGSPNTVSNIQLEELHLHVLEKETQNT